jgi:galactoside O-acetyltransferase
MADFSGLSQGVKLYSTSDDYSGRFLTNPTVPAAYLGVKRGRILLGTHVIVGAGSVVLPGVSLGAGSAVGALSLVREDVEAWTMVAGAPARQIGARRKDLLILEQQLLAGERGRAP